MARNDEIEREKNKNNPDVNPDLITGAEGSHPVGTGIGAAVGGLGGAAAGAAAGALIGAATTGPAAPVGGVIGTVVGALAGAYAGKGVAENVNPTEHDQYWRDNYKDRPYVQAEGAYDEYRAAYEYGWQSRPNYPGRSFADAEDELARGWDQNRGDSKLSWDQARDACCDAWNRCDQPDQRRDSDDQLRPSEGI